MITDWISFGEVAAERDSLLSNYFYDNGVLQRLIGADNQFLVLGRKGAGKTAVFQYLLANSQKYVGEHDLVIGLSMQNYSWSVHELLQSKGKAPSLSYIQSWKYLIYVSVIQELVAKGQDTPKIKAADKLIQRIYRSPVPTRLEAIGQKLLQLSHLRFPGGGLDLESGSLDGVSIDGGEVSFAEVQGDRSLQASLNNTVERLVELFEDALRELFSSSRKVFVCFDRVDEAWDKESVDASKRLIAGLIGASEYINANMKGYVRPIVFLREDIFDSLSLNDKNKLRADCGQLLAWNSDSLSRVILERVNYFARLNNQPVYEDISKFFDKDKMRQSRSPANYLITRTMMRPRDLIRLLSLAKQDMLDRLNDPYGPQSVNTDYLECEAVYSAEPAYSEWLVAELKDEWEAQYPTVISLLEAIQHNASTNLTKAQLQASLNAMGVQPNSVELQAFLRFLFDNSIIGFKPGAFQQWRFKCFHQSQGFVDAEIFKVHDGLTRGSNLKEPRADQPGAEAQV